MWSGSVLLELQRQTVTYLVELAGFGRVGFSLSPFEASFLSELSPSEEKRQVNHFREKTLWEGVWSVRRVVSVLCSSADAPEAVTRRRRRPAAPTWRKAGRAQVRATRPRSASRRHLAASRRNDTQQVR